MTMRRVLHLSDLHFGRTRADLLEPLLAAVNAAAPDLVAISGDLTQRARDWQFEAARAFLDRLEAPRLVVPGNHDVPLDNLALRMTRPFARYRRWICDELEPRHRDPEMFVAGVNTVDPLSWQRGRIGRRAVASACEAFSSVPAPIRILVAHHPFHQRPDTLKLRMRGASRAADAFLDCGADIVLTGHLHAWRAEPFAVRRGRDGSILQIQAGTGLSTRLRGEENDFNLLTLADGRVEVQRFVARVDRPEFRRCRTVRFRASPRGWLREDEDG